MQHKFDYNGFTSYLEGIAGGNRSRDTSKAIVADVKLFFRLTPGSSTDTEKIFNKINLENFFHTLTRQREYKPTTIAEKIRRIKMAVKFLIHRDDCMMTNRDLYIRGNMLIEIMNHWCHSLYKPIALQRQQHSLKMMKRLPLIVDPHEFLDHERVCKMVNG